MYLSRLFLNPRSKQVQRDVRQPYEMHRTIMRAFPDNLPEGEERVLWRVDRTQREGLLILYVQSHLPPEWEKVTTAFADYLLPLHECPLDSDNPAVRDDYPPELRKGRVLSFRVRANPTVKKKVPGKNNGKRVGIVDEQRQLDWLKRKADRGGFAVLSAVPIREDGPDSLKKGERGGKPLSLLSVRFEGVLKVSDPEGFADTLKGGIGSGKALGFGLMSVAPA